MSGDEDLQDRLRRLARSVPQEAGAQVERELRLKFRQRRKRPNRLLVYVTAVAATFAVMAGLYWLTANRRVAAQPRAARVSQPSEFFALPYSQSGVPMEQPVIVRMQVPVSQLGVMGMPLTGAPRSGVVSADFLIGQDGVARAVRLVQ